MPTKENSSLPLLISPRLEGENNREYAYRVLRQNIITLQFAPGQTLSEAELSEKLEMSRTPVHEAVMMLKNEWLVDVQAQRGSSVSMIRVDYLREGFNMRLMLEASIMQQLAGRLTMQQLKPFAACIEFVPDAEIVRDVHPHGAGHTVPAAGAADLDAAVQLVGNAFHSGIFGRGERLERTKGSQIVGQLLLGAHAGQDNMHIVVAAHPAQRPGGIGGIRTQGV
mgnify:CR=1 FL=1